MMKKKLLFSALLLLAVVCMKGQTVATEQMDERFNNGTTMPYGWFAEGWEVDNGVVKANAVKDSGNNGMPGMGNNPGGNNPGGTNPGGGMNMFGGDRIKTYLLTPPVVVQNGENLVFTARKPKGDEGSFSFDLKAMMGMVDTIFVVDRSVYGRDQWVRVGEYTTTLTDEFQEFTISGTPEG
jgi:hypothetical protein